MTDVKSPPLGNPKPTINPLFLRDEELRQAMELLFFAYRDFTAEPDAILARNGFGRAHHRAIYFIGRHPGITISGPLNGWLSVSATLALRQRGVGMPSSVCHVSKSECQPKSSPRNPGLRFTRL